MLKHDENNNSSDVEASLSTCHSSEEKLGSKNFKVDTCVVENNHHNSSYVNNSNSDQDDDDGDDRGPNDEESGKRKLQVERKKSSFDVEALLAPQPFHLPQLALCSSQLSPTQQPQSRKTSECETKHYTMRSNKSKAKSTMPSASPSQRRLGFVENNSNSPFSKIESDNEDVEKWKQTFSKIMARSYKNNACAAYSIKK